MSPSTAPRFDLTTTQGMVEVAKFLDSPVGMVLFPTLYWTRRALDFLEKPSEVSPEKQAEAAVKVIEAARRNGAKRVRFKVEKSVGAKIQGSIQGEASVAGNIGVDGKMELEVEFK